MERKDMAVGQKVRICDSPVDFFKERAGKVGVVTRVETPDYAGDLTVQVTFFDEMFEDGSAAYDWGSHHEITLVVDEPQYEADNDDISGVAFPQQDISNTAWDQKLFGDFPRLAEDNSVDSTVRRKLEQIERLVNEIKIQLGY